MVVFCAGWCLGMSVTPSAAPTTAVMCVSGPYTCTGMPSEAPGRGTRWRARTDSLHRAQALLVIGPAATHEDGHLVLGQHLLVLLQRAHDSLRARVTVGRSTVP